ncbi:lysophospholipid acyltransferase family protein [Actinopolymorpha alba]|uniref:lysophospholipid acyltransferase family protein n=1 Tax=Actinopolymorpha alba TaxID=533267 RepID=UPI0003604252|nr:lysophospholipid acyltransferase family protein [Actinopolymorpha alba]
MDGLEVPPYWHGGGGPPRFGVRATRPLVAGLVRAAWKVRVHDLWHVPSAGPVILASNHTGILDGPLLCGVVRRPVHAVVKEEMFRGVGGVLRNLGQIAVDRQAVDRAAVRSALAVLDRGDVLAIYPEGARCSGDFSTMRAGVAYLALCTGAPVVPVACLGVRPRGGSVGALPALRATLDVVFGQPQALEAIPWPRFKDVVQDRARWLQKWLAAHVRYACEVTGQRLPGGASTEPEPGAVAIARPSTDIEDVS